MSFRPQVATNLTSQTPKLSLLYLCIIQLSATMLVWLRHNTSIIRYLLTSRHKSIDTLDILLSVWKHLNVLWTSVPLYGVKKVQSVGYSCGKAQVFVYGLSLMLLPWKLFTYCIFKTIILTFLSPITDNCSSLVWLLHSYLNCLANRFLFCFIVVLQKNKHEKQTIL